MRMLSRLAENLFWLGRYVERAENIARLLDTARRMAAIPGPEGHRSEWSSILASSGSSSVFPADASQISRQDVVRHLALSADNPSSIFSCIRSARRNARSTREGIPSDCWRIINDSWLELKDLPTLNPSGRSLAEIIERTKYACMAIVGAVEGTVLRNETYDFIRLGTMIERADSTARILDVKYFALLPEDEDIEGGRDTYQWMTILDATSTRRVFRRLYGTDLRAASVAELLMQNTACVRSLAYSVTRMQTHLANLTYGWQTGPRTSVERANNLKAKLTSQKAEQIIIAGLHEYLGDFIRDNNALAASVGEDFNFVAPTMPARTSSQAQSDA